MKSNRFRIVYSFGLFYIVLCFLIRLCLLLWSWNTAQLSLYSIVIIFFKGFVFDIGAACFLLLPASLYLLILPVKMIGSKLDKILVYTGLSLTLFLVYFSTFAEFTFWDEFQSRFNFIAVDYLIYTYEVVQNINQSYPLPLLIGGMALCTVLSVWLFNRTRILIKTFNAPTPFRNRLAYGFLPIIVITAFYIGCVPNRWAEHDANNYVQELSKNGIYSFFAAFRSNELDYNDFYLQKDANTTILDMRRLLIDKHSQYVDSNTIYRKITSDTEEIHPNVILITIESFSADFMAHFGNTKHITPFLDSLADQSILLNHLYATGTRTVRGMEALTLSIPPTPGNSIVRRNDNQNLFNIGTVFKSKHYSRSFFYGGDGYFDNMNNFFSGNGFDIVDHGRKIDLSDGVVTKRTLIPGKKVHFENAWGICDEDLYDEVLEQADIQTATKKPFFDFIMTTSNHKPYTYPTGKIDIPSGSGRDGAVKYTDYAIRKFMEKAQQKPWFKNTVFVIVADHCANSAGKDAVEVSKYHIPCLIYNLPKKSGKIDRLCSQIDIFPTLFYLMGWNYYSSLFGKNILDSNYVERALPASYQVLGYMEKNQLSLLSPVKKVSYLNWSYSGEERNADKPTPTLLDKDIIYYESAYTLYKNGLLKERK